MAAWNPGDVCLMKFNGHLFNQQVINTFHFGAAVTVVGTSDLTAFTALFTKLFGVGDMISQFLDCCPPEYLLDNVTIQKIAPQRIVARVFNVGTIGTNVKHTDTSNLQASIVRRGEAANKHNVGAIRIPYPSGDAIAGFVTAGYKITLNTLATTSVAVQTAGGNQFQPVLFPGGTTDITKVQIITTAFAQSTIRVIRRRTVGVGK